MPAPTAIEAALAGAGTVRFHADEAGWFAAEVSLGPGSPVRVERWLADEEGIRDELNSWAAYLETLDYNPHHRELMERAIQTQQLFTIRRPIDCADEALLDRVVEALCRHLATVTEGFYQADGRGFFAADGTRLIEEY
jgi:hypothetical protein